jgi:ribosomal protein S18 acetylase RimI-like enzyme
MLQNTKLIELDKNNPEHLQVMYSVRTHPEVDRYLRQAPPENFAQHVHYLQNIGPHKKFYLIQSKSILCGYCQLTVTEDHIEIGMALHPSYFGQGIGSMALSQLLASIRQNQELKNKALILFVNKDNFRAIALYAKYGFQRVGNENEYEEYLMKADSIVLPIALTENTH